MKFGHDFKGTTDNDFGDIFAEDGGNVTKYNQVILDLLQAENVNNAIIKEINGKIVVAFNNNEGGIALITNGIRVDITLIFFYIR